MEQRHPAGADTQHRRPQESLQGTNREHKGKYKGWCGNKRRTRAYRSRRKADTQNGNVLKGVNGGGVVHYIYYRGLNAGHDKGLQSYCF